MANFSIRLNSVGAVTKHFTDEQVEFTTQRTEAGIYDIMFTEGLPATLDYEAVVAVASSNTPSVSHEHAEIAHVYKLSGESVIRVVCRNGSGEAQDFAVSVTAQW